MYSLKYAVYTLNTVQNILELVRSTQQVTVPHEPANNCVGSDVSGFRVVNRRSFCGFFFFSDLCVLCAPQSCPVSKEGRRNGEGVGQASEKIPILSMV